MYEDVDRSRTGGTLACLLNFKFSDYTNVTKKPKTHVNTFLITVGYQLLYVNNRNFVINN